MEAAGVLIDRKRDGAGAFEFTERQGTANLGFVLITIHKFIEIANRDARLKCARNASIRLSGGSIGSGHLLFKAQPHSIRQLNIQKRLEEGIFGQLLTRYTSQRVVEAKAASLGMEKPERGVTKERRQGGRQRSNVLTGEEIV